MSIESLRDGSLDISAPTSTANTIYTPNSSQLALEDFIAGIKKWPVWALLAYQDIKLRYRRSALGPFWITISMAITVYSMGFLYGHLFRTNLHQYFPFLAAGLLAWAFYSSAIIDLSDAFIAADGLIKQIKLPYTLYIHRVVARNFIIFFHNIVVIIPILIIFHKTVGINWNTLLLVPNLFLIYINTLFYGMVLGILCARFRDVPQIIRSVIQVIFFVTPVIWDPLILPEKYQFFALLNPFYAFVQLLRAPLLGIAPTSSVYLIAIFSTLFGLWLSTSLFVKFRARIVYWL